jgi:hypothetical protein
MCSSSVVSRCHEAFLGMNSRLFPVDMPRFQFALLSASRSKAVKSPVSAVGFPPFPSIPFLHHLRLRRLFASALNDDGRGRAPTQEFSFHPNNLGDMHLRRILPCSSPLSIRGREIPRPLMFCPPSRIATQPRKAEVATSPKGVTPTLPGLPVYSFAVGVSLGYIRVSRPEPDVPFVRSAPESPSRILDCT